MPVIEVRMDELGRRYYWNHTEMTSDWVPPPPQIGFWQRLMDYRPVFLPHKQLADAMRCLANLCPRLPIPSFCAVHQRNQKSPHIMTKEGRIMPCPIVRTCSACSHVLSGAGAHTTTILAQRRLYGSSLCHRQLSQEYQGFIHLASTSTSTVSRTNHFFILHHS